jgi:AcrR family transcriptional regulator
VSIVTSPGHYDLTLPRRRLADLLLTASGATIGAPGPAEPEPVGGSPRQNRDRVLSSRRELLLAAAAWAFRERGFGGVRLDEFGIVGPAVYRYFDGKQDILETLIARLQDWITLEDSRALGRAVEDADVVVELVRGYIRVAVEATDLLAVSVTEALYLSDRAAERERRVRTDNIAEWVRWLRVARPDLPDPAAQTLVHATRTMINDVVRVPRLAQDPAFRSELESCALAVLLATELPWKTSGPAR